jgi:hypothetical protein
MVYEIDIDYKKPFLEVKGKKRVQWQFLPCNEGVLYRIKT